MTDVPARATLKGLARTLLLLRDHVGPDVPDRSLGEALTRTRIAIVGDRPNLQVESAQHAFVTSALLSARSGASVHLVAPDLPLLGEHPPLRGDRLDAALLDALEDLIPDVHGAATLPSEELDLAIMIGDTPWSGRARRIVRLQANAWSGGIVGGGGTRWGDHASPFGALASAEGGCWPPARQLPERSGLRRIVCSDRRSHGSSRAGWNSSTLWRHGQVRLCERRRDHPSCFVRAVPDSRRARGHPRDRARGG